MGDAGREMGGEQGLVVGGLLQGATLRAIM